MAVRQWPHRRKLLGLATQPSVGFATSWRWQHTNALTKCTYATPEAQPHVLDDHVAVDVIARRFGVRDPLEVRKEAWVDNPHSGLSYGEVRA